MTFRTRFLLMASSWVVLVAVGLVLVPLLVRERLPDPVASHWAFSGQPDRTQPFGLLLVMFVLLWLVLVAVALGALGRIRQRSGRSWMLVLLAGGGVFTIGMTALTIWANLDVASWHAARPVTWHVALVLVCCVPAGWLGWYLARFGPDERPPRTSAVPQGRVLNSRENVVWVSVTSNPVLRAVGLVAAAGLVVAVAGGASGWLAVNNWGVGIGLALTAVTMLVLSSVRVRADRDGVEVAVGSVRWPRKRIDLDRIEAASFEQRNPRNVGGWGYRGLPGNATVMIRGGECLVLHYHGGGELGISVDDAEGGADLINGLLAERVAARG